MFIHIYPRNFAKRIKSYWDFHVLLKCMVITIFTDFSENAGRQSVNKNRQKVKICLYVKNKSTTASHSVKINTDNQARFIGNYYERSSFALDIHTRHRVGVKGIVIGPPTIIGHYFRNRKIWRKAYFISFLMNIFKFIVFFFFYLYAINILPLTIILW